ncbi:hypothetical protein B9T31_12060 [Acinetobacter sp. ANC 4558]|uniref:M14 family metallopeptidase n=1 Tax=Acinetobacter sp. ANC 4558 TaxID=1977876 RepID=UPI000A3526D1|nr:M14 family metallopeptidase [Acinetobacter sp. ANC 4558]OTG85518.1 hypothetical protein B9T31_12060 [Acinetobacter sp. ANC 4558]
MAIITMEKLENADKDADSLDDFVSGNGKKKVKTRRGIEYLTAPGVEQTLLDNGLKRGFANKAALEKYKPSIEGSLAQDMETKKVWLWDGAKWNDTGASDKDLAIAHSDAEIAKTNETITNISATTTEKINEIQAVDFYSQEKSKETKTFRQTDSEGNILIAFDDDGFLQQNFKSDFHSEEKLSSFLIVDHHLNIIFANEEDEQFLKDFFRDQNQPSFSVVDSQFNLLIGENKKSDDDDQQDIDFSKLQNNALNPEPLNTTKDLYSDFGVIKRMQDYTDDLYNLPIRTLIGNTASLYTLYDALVNTYASMSSQEIGSDALGNIIKAYTYKPIPFEMGMDSELPFDLKEMIKPKHIVITTGVHGNEKDAMLQMYIFLKEILERKEDIQEASLLSNARITVVPVINPTGTNAHTRFNHNQVNLNRNGEYKWGAFPGEQGSGPLSEKEAQIASALPVTFPDATCFVDFHNFWPNITGNGVGWLGASRQDTVKVIRNVAIEINSDMRRYKLFSDQKLMRVGLNYTGTLSRDWIELYNKRGYLLETPVETAGFNRYKLRQYGLDVVRKTLAAVYKYELTF